MKNLAVTFFLFVSTAMGQEAGVFVPAAEMTTTRVNHTATLLADGRVLIAGGVGPRSAARLQSAELYDPVAGTFTRTADMTTGRSAHSATRLYNGMVLIAGGMGSNLEPLATAELYDPSTGTFVAVGNLITAQMGHAAILLQNGKVLIAGGLIPSRQSPQAATAEIYDPLTNTFVPAGDYAVMNSLYPRAGGVIWPNLTRLADGRVLVTGNNPAEVYDPILGTFRVTGDMGSQVYRYGMYFHSGTLLLNGKVLVAGGTDEWNRSDTPEVYDPATGTFAAAGRMSVGRSSHTSTLMPDGSVLITGGDTWNSWGGGGAFGGSLASAERYDPSTGTFSRAGTMAVSRSAHQATLLQNGHVLITGGMTYYPFVGAGTPPTPPTAPSAELYIPPVSTPAPEVVSAGRNGQIIEIYATGLEGMPGASSVIPPEVVIGGSRGDVLFVGEAPGTPGVSRVDVRVPDGVETREAVAVRLFYLERPSNEVTVSLR
jgi:hypothetical protein